MSLNVLLVSDTMIKDRTVIHGNIDPKLIYPDIKVAQDMYILPLLGTALFNKIQSLVSNGTIGSIGNEDYKTLLDSYLIDALIYYTLADLPTTISFQFWNKGMIRSTGENKELPSMGDLIDISNKYKNRAEFYANRMRLYVRQNAPTKFPEYIAFGSGVDDIRPDQKAFTNPVWLGDDCDNDRRSYEEKYQGNRPNCC